MHGTTAAFWDEIHMVEKDESRDQVKAKVQCASLVAEGFALIGRRNTAQKAFLWELKLAQERGKISLPVISQCLP